VAKRISFAFAWKTYTVVTACIVRAAVRNIAVYAESKKVSNIEFSNRYVIWIGDFPRACASCTKRLPTARHCRTPWRRDGSASLFRTNRFTLPWKDTADFHI